jgi:N-acetyltransferase B complex (NatB) non catalytic subunit
MSYLYQTALGTLVITLQSLRLFLTSYQLYCWAAAKMGIDLFLRKAFLHGLGVVVSPQYTSITKDVFANLQVLALQLARVNQQTGSTRLSTSWVAQTALWQLNLVKNGDDSSSDNLDDPKEQQRLAFLPRLAENLASKCMEEPVEGELASARREVYFLYLRILEYQRKWGEMLELLQSDVFKASDETGVSLAPKQQVMEKQAECLQKLEKFRDARLVLESLLVEYPDNFTYWKQHLECSLAEHDDDANAFQPTEQFAQKIVEKSKADKYPKRGPHLISVQVATKRIELAAAQGSGACPSELVDGAAKSIIEYGDMFGSSVSCAFTDLEPYLIVTIEHSKDHQITAVLEWLRNKMNASESDDQAERKRQQRAFIFTVKMTHRIIAKHENLAEAWLPDWKDLVRKWKETHTSDEPTQVGFIFDL